MQKGERAAVERHRESVLAIVSTINILKGSIEEVKFGQGESETDIEKRPQEVDEQIAQADQCFENLDMFVKDVDMKAE